MRVPSCLPNLMFNYAQAKAVIMISVADEFDLFTVLARFDVVDHGGMWHRAKNVLY